MKDADAATPHPNKNSGFFLAGSAEGSSLTSVPEVAVAFSDTDLM